MKSKWLAVGIILLFFGVAVAPSINQSVVKASNDDDLVDVTTYDEKPHYILEQPRVDIYNVTGGYGIHATLKNCWGDDLTNMNWSIDIIGGMFNLIHRVKSDTIPVFHPNQEIIIYSGILLGWGWIKIRIIADLNVVYHSGEQYLFRTAIYPLPTSEIVEMMPVK